jgi:hypothetical protein
VAFWNLFNYVSYLHQEQIKLKQTYETILSIVIQELPGIKARMEASAKHNVKIVEKKTHHPEKRIICQFCGENFDGQWKLETHLVVHEEAEKFPCDVCNKLFQTNWRLRKHQQNHERKNVRMCKYFKKGQFCPFEKVGCKFSHSSSKVENENISDNESKDKSNLKNNISTLDENVENILDHRNNKVHESDCQGCGQFPEEFECVQCTDRFCSKCMIKDHMKNVHYCLNCEDDVI